LDLGKPVISKQVLSGEPAALMALNRHQPMRTEFILSAVSNYWFRLVRLYLIMPVAYPMVADPEWRLANQKTPRILVFH
jgi:hypothetical protein